MTPYYIDLGLLDVRAGMYNAFDFDKDGIPRYPYKNGLFHNVTFICHFALYHHMLFLKFKREKDFDHFSRISTWLLKTGRKTSTGFLFPFSFEFNGLRPPWISALTQGRVLSVLARAYEFSNNEQYLEMAQEAMRPFEIPVERGGVQASFPNGDMAFEEYPSCRPNIALNGFVTSLVGLHDLAHIGKNRSAGTLLAHGIHSLTNNLPRYDLGFWSTYDLAHPFPTMANEKYHLYHITQMWGLYEMTGNEIFKNYASKWHRYLKGLTPFAIRTLSRSYKLFKPVIAKATAALPGKIW